jgi:O-methyltransferase
MNPQYIFSLVRRSVKDVLFQTPFARFIAPRWQFNYTPSQLAFLCQCVSRTRSVSGPVFEVGCFAGATTVFLKCHMSAEGIEKSYYAFDTFEGFTADDLAHEVNQRGKTGESLQGFTDNKQSWFDRTMSINGLSVRSVQADVTRYDFASLDAPAFCLLDVDLYMPVKKVLEALYDRLAPGAIVVVDDCKDGGVFDGAYQAYAEFVSAHGLPMRIEFGKLGVVEKPLA